MSSALEQYKLQLQKKETELGVSRETEVKCSARLNELAREAEKTRSEVQEYTRKIQECTSQIQALTEENEEKTKRILELEKDAERYRLTMKQYIQKL